MSDPTFTKVQVELIRSFTDTVFPTGHIKKLSCMWCMKRVQQTFDNPWDVLVEVEAKMQGFFLKLCSDHLPLIHSWLLVQKESTVDQEPIHLKAMIKQKSASSLEFLTLEIDVLMDMEMETAGLQNVQLVDEGWF